MFSFYENKTKLLSNIYIFNYFAYRSNYYRWKNLISYYIFNIGNFLHLKIWSSKNCFCKQHFKSILTQDAVSEFSGLVYVAKGSHGVDSQQLNQNLLFSDSARVLSRPQLKIDADDVQCAHGSTIGQLNPEEIHYIKSRGLTEQEAKSLLTFGFAEEIINEISDDTVKKELTSVVKQIIGSLKVTDEK